MEISKVERKTKVKTLQEAADMVKDGMTIAIGGLQSNNSPNAFVREIIRRRLKNLTLILTNNAGYHADILIGAGCVKKVYMSYIGLDYLGFAPNFKRIAEAGKLEVVDLDEMGLFRALKAGSSGMAFSVLPDGMRAIDNIRINPNFYKEIDDPFTGKRVAVVRPLRSDVAVVYCITCDAYGNARQEVLAEDYLYMSADKVIVITEELTPLDATIAQHEKVTIQGFIVDAVVETQFAAHPGEACGHYAFDDEHMREYQKAGNEDSTFSAYLDKYVYEPKNHLEYLERIGMPKLLKLRRLATQ